jgi:hypothetical protein
MSDQKQMKNTTKVTRVKLNMSQRNDVILLGLVSSEPDYKISLALNNKFNISLKNISPVKIDSDTGNEQLFSRFSDIAKSPDLIFNLISNRSGKYFLIKKLKNIDYLFHVQDEENETDVKNITSGLREMPVITAVFNIDVNSIKDKNLGYIIE